MEVYMKKTLLSFLLAAFTSVTSYAGDIIDEWSDVIAPAAPKLSEVEASASDTALLILDIEERTCNADRRPRCLDTVPAIAALMKKAREAGMTVLYSTTSKGTPETILPPVKPLEGEHVVKSSVNKFYGTDLDTELKKRNIKNVIVTGTAAHGAVLHTATAASYMGYKVIAPVDCLSAAELYTEQATVWNLATGPANRNSTTLTKSGMIKITK
jgi:nicotinamidase-related amidase